MGIYPIRNEVDHKRARGRIETLMDKDALAPEEGDELNALVTLVEAYEEKHFPIGDSTPAQIIEFMMDQRGLTRKDLEPMLGSRARVSEILNGKRTLTLGMIRRLHADLGIPVDLLITVTAPVTVASRENRLRRSKSPQEKKELSLYRDRRNAYGENAKSSRKNIPKSKRLSQRAARHAADAPLRVLTGNLANDAAVDAELQSRTQSIKKDRNRFRKERDKPLGQVLQRKAASGSNSWKALGNYPPA